MNVNINLNFITLVFFSHIHEIATDISLRCLKGINDQFVIYFIKVDFEVNNFNLTSL